MTVDFFPHGNMQRRISSTAWLDNGSYAIRQPHTSNATETRFSQQLLKSSNSLTANSQGAMLKHHDWLFMSTWSSSNFNNIVQRMYTTHHGNQQYIWTKMDASPQKHSSCYGMWDSETVYDDEDYRNFQATNTHTPQVLQLHITEFWNLMFGEMFGPSTSDVSPQFRIYCYCLRCQ